MGASGIAWAYTLLSLKQQGISGKKKKITTLLKTPVLKTGVLTQTNSLYYSPM